MIYFSLFLWFFFKYCIESYLCHLNDFCYFFMADEFYFFIFWNFFYITPCLFFLKFLCDSGSVSSAYYRGFESWNEYNWRSGNVTYCCTVFWWLYVFYFIFKIWNDSPIFFCTQLFDAFHYIQYVRIALHLIHCHIYNSSTIFNTPFLGCFFCLKFLLFVIFEKRLKFIPLSRNFIKKLKKINKVIPFD